MSFNYKPSPAELNEYSAETMARFLGIEFVETGDNYLIARMPVNEKTHQALGMLHGGASCVLAEQTGSMAANLYLNRETHVALGLDINANHLKGVKSGYVYAKAMPAHIGRTTQVWEIKITDEMKDLVCISRLTMIVVPITESLKRKKLLSNEG